MNSRVLFTCILLLLSISGWAKNGFDVSNSSIPEHLILAGGPPKDGIPAIVNPKFQAAVEATWLEQEDRVLGISLNGEQRAYPISILNWHEIVNDTIGNQSVVVSFCPLCGTGMVFDSRLNDTLLTFGVSGLLFESDVLLYDQQSESLWSQIWMQAISGPYKGKELRLLASEHTTWRDWKARYPETSVLSRNTGFTRDYNRNPFAGYELQKRLYFPVQNSDDSLHSKAWVVGIVLPEGKKAYSFEALKKAKQPVLDKIGETEIRIELDDANQVARIWQGEKLLPSIQAYWFAWYAFYPDSEVMK